MINVSQVYDNLIADGAKIDWQILNGSNTWTVENLITGSLTNTLFEKLSIGNVVSAQLNLTLRNVEVDTTAPIVLQFRANFNEGESVSEWITKGKYYLDTLETSPYSEITKITAFDALFKTEFTYMASGTWTERTDLSIVLEIASAIGVPVEASTRALFENAPRTLIESPNIGQEGSTRREVLSAIGAMRVGNWYINASEQLTLAQITTTPSNTAQVGDALRDFDASPVERFTKVRVWIDSERYYPAPQLPLITHNDEPIETHDGKYIAIRASQFIPEWEAIEGLCFDVNVPFWGNTDVADAILEAIGNSDFYPYISDFAFVDVKYELSDGIVLKDVESIIANITTDITPLAPSSVSFGKTEILENTYKYIPSFERNISYEVKNIIPDKIKDAVITATEQITGERGGHIVIVMDEENEPDELLIMDTKDKSTAVNVWRWNLAGLGHSHSGYAGPFDDVAITQDGKINANLLQVGVITDASGKNFWNLNTGEFSTKQGTIGSGTISTDNIAFYSADGRNRTLLAEGGVIVQNYNDTENCWQDLIALNGAVDGRGRAYASIGNSWQGELTWGPGIGMYIDCVGLEVHAVGTSQTVPNFFTFDWQGLTVAANFQVGTGYTKNKVFETAEYGKRLLYCYETPSPLYGDVGEGEIGADGTAYIWLDPIFAETIKTGQYQVQLQAYGQGECYVVERAGAYFKVQGTAGLPFGWELKAKQGDLGDKRLDAHGNEFTPPQSRYGDLAVEHLEEIQKGRVA